MRPAALLQLHGNPTVVTVDATTLESRTALAAIFAATFGSSVMKDRAAAMEIWQLCCDEVLTTHDWPAYECNTLTQ